MPGAFVTGTGTGVGKTWLARGIARGFVRRGVPVAAVKPVETGCAGSAVDAEALGRACGRPALATLAGFVRFRAALSPFAACLEGEPACPSAERLAAATLQAGAGALLVVEGAGGLFTPLTATETIAELAVALKLPLIVAAPDVLGCLSAVLALAEAARHRELAIAAIVLTPVAGLDGSHRTNAQILAERLGVPVHRLPAAPDDDDALADAVTAITRTPTAQ